MELALTGFEKGHSFANQPVLAPMTFNWTSHMCLSALYAPDSAIIVDYGPLDSGYVTDSSTGHCYVKLLSAVETNDNH